MVRNEDNLSTFAHDLKRSHSIFTLKLQVLMGLLIGLFVLTQSAATTVAPPEQDGHEKSDTSSPSEKNQVAEAVTTSSSQINLGFQSILLLEVILDNNEQENKSSFHFLAHPTAKAFKYSSGGLFLPMPLVN